MFVAGACNEGEPVGVDCSAHPRCGVDEAGCESPSECFSIPGCGGGLCIPGAQACRETCGTASCAVLESYPAQIACDGRKPAPGRNGSGGNTAAGGAASSGGSTVDCSELNENLSGELRAARACSSDAECGQPIAGTSCGCTRNLVARSDADLTRVQALLEELQRNECDAGLISTCDCPAADGFRCTSGACTWNYTR